MKLNRLETHDRFKHFTSQNFNIAECVQDVIKQMPFGNHPFYIFAHTRTDDDGVTKRMIWQPRLTKPKSQSNSMLFKVCPGTDIIEIIWIIPDRTLWDQYKQGNVTENDIVRQSIHDFIHSREKLDQKDPKDLSDEQIDQIYRQISKSSKYRPI